MSSLYWLMRHVTSRAGARASRTLPWRLCDEVEFPAASSGVGGDKEGSVQDLVSFLRMWAGSA